MYHQIAGLGSLYLTTFPVPILLHFAYEISRDHAMFLKQDMASNMNRRYVLQNATFISIVKRNESCQKTVNEILASTWESELLVVYEYSLI